MQSIWASILPNAPSPIPLDESFFDLGGHSILATRLIFEIRKVFVVNAPLGLIFEQPTIAGLVAAVESLRNADLGLTYQEPTPVGAVAAGGQALGVPGVGAPKKATAAPLEYGQDYINLLEKLKPSYPSLPSDFYDHPVTVFLTGATGFLGAFVLKDLLSREERVKKVICLVRGSDQEKALARLREGSTDRGVWDEKWVQERRLEVVTGDLGLDSFGLAQGTWDKVAAEADVVLHNGALVSSGFKKSMSSLTCTSQVHWVYPYERLRAPNVNATLTAMELASTGKPKSLVFVSSTSAIDTEHYVNLSETLAHGRSEYKGIPENDDLDGAKSNLKTGYGQTKWVSEKLLFEAGKRGLNGHIIRPGYVVGDSKTAGKCLAVP